MKKSFFALATLVLAVACAPEFNPFTSGISGTITGATVAANWADDASINYFAGAQAQQFTITSGAGSQTAKFAPAGEAVACTEITGCVAIAPYFDKATVSYDGTTADVVASFPATQTIAAAGQFPTAPMVAVGAAKASKLNFKMAAGAVTVKLAGDNINITKIQIASNAKETLNGSAEITVEAGEITEVEMLEDGTNEIALECGEGIAISKVAKEFNAFVPAGTYSKGFTVVITASDGAQNTVEVEGPVTIAAGKATKIVDTTFAPFVDLNETVTETANCYVITKGGCYFFDATVKGNGAAGIHETFAAAGADTDASLNPANAKLVWSEIDGLVSNVFYKEGHIYFSCSGKDGNAVVAALDADGKVIWSWHIWSTLAPEDVECTEVSGEGNTHYYMNKNLGATEPLDPGMYYQWGRKDPFSLKLGFCSQDTDDEIPVSGQAMYAHHGCFNPGDGSNPPAEIEDIYGTVQYATANPSRYIAHMSNKIENNTDWEWFYKSDKFRWRWGLSHKDIGDAGGNANCSFSPFGKTIYDPCPAGYMVATPTGWANGGGFERVGNDGISTYGGKLFVPHSGFVYNCGWGCWDTDKSGDGTNDWAGLWSCSSSWGNVNNAFRLQDTDDPRSNYGAATGHPVRCEKLNK